MRSALPLSSIRDAELVVVIGDDPVVERAPVVDLWIRQHGGRVPRSSPSAAGSIQRPPGDGAGPSASCSARRSASGRTPRAWRSSGPARAAGAAQRSPARGSAGPRASTAAAPFSSQRRRTDGLSPRPGRARRGRAGRSPERVGPLLISGEEAVADPRFARSQSGATRSPRDDVLRVGSRLDATSSCPGRATSSATARWSTSRAASSACGRRRAAGRADLDWIASSPRASASTTELPAIASDARRPRRCGHMRPSRREPLHLPSRRSSA